MIDRRHFLLSASALAASALSPVMAVTIAKRPWPLPPQHRRVPTDVGGLGYARMDDYAWFQPKDWHAVLRAPESLDAPVKEAVKLENDYTDAMLAPSAPLQKALIARMEALDAVAGSAAEIRSGDYLYYESTPPGSDYPVYLRRPIKGGKEQVLLDVGLEAKGKKHYKIGWIAPRHSLDGRLFVWSADMAGSGIFSIFVRDIASGKMLVAYITNGHSGYALSPDGRYLYWIGRSDKGRPSTIYRREVGTPGDTLIYE